VFHHGPAAQARAEITVAALPLPFGLEPIVMFAAAFLAPQAFGLPLNPKMFPATFLGWEFFNES
jgi:hypothetical protein